MPRIGLEQMRLSGLASWVPFNCHFLVPWVFSSVHFFFFFFFLEELAALLRVLVESEE